MQSQDEPTRTPDALNHPGAAEWMTFLYAEATPERKGEMETHLARCPDCAAKVSHWRAARGVLDTWAMPTIRRTKPASRPALREWWPTLRWAAAAGVILVLGFGLGRRTAPSTMEFAALKASVAQLSDSALREQSRNWTNAVNIATAAANAETLRLLSDFAQLQARNRAVEQEAVSLALRNFETRLGRLRAELETVAVNTEDGFERTHENLSRLASFSAPIKIK